MNRLEGWARPFAGFGGGIAKFTGGVYRVLGAPGRLLQDTLNGSYLGHSTHGLLTDAAVGAVTALLVLDAAGVLFGASDLETASRIVLAFGVLSAWGAVAAGLTDHKDIDPGNARNVATLHGLVNITATVVYTIALFVRLSGGVASARWLSLIGFVLLASGAFIGGHLVYKFGVMVNFNAFAPGRRAKEFTPILPAAELPEGAPTKATLGTTSLVLVRRGDVVYALKESCSHAGGPLAQGTLKGDTITCPWHGSVFRLADGAVVHGPAQTREVTYAARINEGQVEVQGPKA
ncbi:MAG: Rieske 2Fe-2S domain-containing protein [Chloroflexota bacterium]|nr:Rieske 2Fe-2S domain-containing protein [Chloroflexota bacterium]